MKNQKFKKIGVSVAMLLIGVFAYFGFINDYFIGKTFLNTIDKEANAYLDETMKKALVTFAVVRGINAIISVIQDSDVAVSPAGVGITIAVGEILDPINDLIERFSWVMLASSTSLGIQKILMNIGIWLGFKVLLTLSMITVLIGIWFPKLMSGRLRYLGYKLVLISIIIRFCIPVIAIATSGIDTLFLHHTYEKASKTLEEVGEEITTDEKGGERATTDPNILQKIKRFFQNIEFAANIDDKIQNLKETLSSYTGYIIDLIVVFVLQTIVVPLVLLWLLVRLFSEFLGMHWVGKLKPAFTSKITGSKTAAETL
jgi:hypothetical protein